ncbi:toprim domain-containing protein [Aureimonas ureilytica]|uniref:hypothetical protein n=1 Tax=Aureimonas ureilytica TaxID=401562 RepID=UPI0003A6D213|nr:hypothetical protein [Aureimonas ureilytica]
MTGSQSSARDLFVEEARGVELTAALSNLPLSHLSDRIARGELIGSCPACGGTDRLGVNPGKPAWVCRGSAGGRDAIGLAAHVLGLDASRAGDFLEACAAVLGRPVPDGSTESEDERRERQARIAERKRQNEEAAAKRDREANDFRAAEQARARGKWLYAKPDGQHVVYLARRLDCYAHELPIAPFLRTSANETYWHGKDDRDPRAVPVELFTRPAMVAPFVAPSGHVIGCHLTWIDLDRRPKFRPLIIDPKDPKGEPLPSKKMRGTKKGGMIPLVGFFELDGLILPDPHRPRFVVGEGIENTLAIALVEGPRADTIYASAGDLGNLAGPADAKGRFAHPTLKKADRNGVLRPVWVGSPTPKPEQAPDEALQAPPGARDILLLADGDSEVHATASAMARARTRLEASGALVTVAWPPRGSDFADILALSSFGQ